MTERVRLTGRGEAVDPSKGAPTDEKLPDGQHADHWILSDEDRAKGFVRPVRTQYRHVGHPSADDRIAGKVSGCGSITTQPLKIAETYASQPSFYGRTFCAYCGEYFPVGADGEFEWLDGSKVGT